MLKCKIVQALIRLMSYLIWFIEHARITLYSCWKERKGLLSTAQIKNKWHAKGLIWLWNGGFLFQNYYRYVHVGQSCVIQLLEGFLNPIALRIAKTLWSFGHSNCNRIKSGSRIWGLFWKGKTASTYNGIIWSREKLYQYFLMLQVTCFYQLYNSISELLIVNSCLLSHENKAVQISLSRSHRISMNCQVLPKLKIKKKCIVLSDSFQRPDRGSIG